MLLNDPTLDPFPQTMQTTTNIPSVGYKQKILGQATTRRDSEFKKAWHCMDISTFNRHLHIPIIYQQLKQTPNPQLSSLSLLTRTHPTNIQTTRTTRINTQSRNHNNTINNQPIRRSNRLQLKETHE